MSQRINIEKKNNSSNIDKFSSNSDDNDSDIGEDKFYDCPEIDELCKSPPVTERAKKLNSRKYKSKYSSLTSTGVSNSLISSEIINESSEVSEITTTTTTASTATTTTTSTSTILTNHTKINRSNLKLSLGNQTSQQIQLASSITAAASTQHESIIKSRKPLSRVNSLPSLGAHKKIFNSYNSSGIDSTNTPDGKNNNEMIYDIDDDLIKCFHEPESLSNDGIIDEYKIRTDFYNKFSLILKFMLKPVNSFDLLRTNSNDHTNLAASFSAGTGVSATPQTSSLPSYVYEYYYYYNNQMPTNEQLQSHSNENLWFNLYDYFVNYNKRARTLDEIKENLHKTRANCVKSTINYVLNLNFSLVTQSMQEDINLIQTVSDYRRLNEFPKYICKLSYLYCYIEDILNQVGYIESLFPSLKALENEEPLYASEEFNDRIKTMLLWYNIMTDLMRQCDLFGRFLGFTKRDNYLKLWTWFDKNQNYSRRDYEKIQLLLLGNQLIPTPNTPLLRQSKSTTINSLLTPQISLNMTKSTTCNVPISSSSTISTAQSKPPKFNRQVSFELNASKPTKNLIYNRVSLDDSMIGSLTLDSSPNRKLFKQNSAHNSFGNSSSGNGNGSGSSMGSFVSTPLPQKLQKFFSCQSSSSSHKSNDSIPPSLYASIIRNSFDEECDEEDEDEESYNNNNNNTESNSNKPSDNDFLTCDNEYHNTLLNSDLNSTLNSHDDNTTINNPQQLNITRVRIYQDFIHKRLCKQGLGATCKQILNMIGNTLPRARQALETQNNENSKTKSATIEFFAYHWMPLHKKCRDYISKYNFDDETLKYSINCKQFKQLNLPTFRPLYLYLINCIIDLMNICMKMYINMYNDYNFSFSLLSTEQLTNECRECIEHAILVRQYYHYMIFSVFEKNELDKNPIENDLERYDNDLKDLINIYLKYVANWVRDTINVNSLSLNVLEKEWNFCKNNLCYVSIGEDSYAKSFCIINSIIIGSLSNYLEDIDNNYKYPFINFLDDLLITSQETYSDNDDVDNDNEGNGERKKKTNSMFELGPSAVEHENDLNDDIESIHYKCNELKLLIRDLRERTLKALTFCRSFMNDLELAAKYQVSRLNNLFYELKLTNHVLINLNDSNNKKMSYMIFVPLEFSHDSKQILRLLYMTSARDDTSGRNNRNNDESGSNTNTVETIKTSTNKQIASAIASTPLTTTVPTLSDNVNNMKRRHNPVRRLTSANITDNARQNQKSFLHSLSILANVNNVTTGAGGNGGRGEDFDNSVLFSKSLPHSPQLNSSSYVLYLSISAKDQECEGENLKWSGIVVPLNASVDVKMSLFQHKTDPQVSYLYLIVPQPQLLPAKRVELKSRLQGNITLVKEKTSFHSNIADELDELNTKILKKFRADAFDFIKTFEEATTKHYATSLITSTQIFPPTHRNLIKPKFLLEIWRVCYNFGIELHSECTKFVTQDLQKDFSIGLAEFCKIWCNYVLSKTEEGYGRTTKPSWARKGFQLMNEAFKPQNAQHLRHDEFNELRIYVERCIKHVIGTKRENKTLTALQASHFQHKGSFDIIDANAKRKLRSLINYEKSLSLNSNEGNHLNVPPKLTTNSSASSTSSSHIIHSQSSVLLRAQEFMEEQKLKTLLPPHKRFSLSCRQCDEDRTNLLNENRLIGQVIYRQQTLLDMNQAKINVRRVDFRWQRGNKIGTGQFGIVYACVNLDTGEMMAMKEINYKPNDLQMIKALADEIANIEGIKHENLVKFYGVELHKKEILIFMEFCGDKCTLDHISRESSGLPEELVRSYTYSLLQAVYTLHENNIIHRDIKGANIFLKTTETKNERKTTLKLGDFGSSIRLRADPNTNSGLFAQGFMGTLSYMAPEVMMSGGHRDGIAGYTFSADIWSVGCVVIEMFTGKRPWFPLKDENIMFKVFNREKPPFPPNINEEATDFLRHCLEYDPKSRYSASALLHHAFSRIAGDRFST